MNEEEVAPDRLRAIYGRLEREQHLGPRDTAWLLAEVSRLRREIEVHAGSAARLPGEPSEEAKLAVAKIFCCYGDTGFNWDEETEITYGNNPETRTSILGDAAVALRAAYAIDRVPSPGGGARTEEGKT